jgi:16S rRNA (cytidine1402-2'-O)-methyltransferase
LAVCRELSKIHEEIVRGTLTEARQRFEADPPRGEVTLVIGGASPGGRWTESDVRAAVRARVAAGTAPSRAAGEVAKLSGWRKRDVYRLAEEE